MLDKNRQINLEKLEEIAGGLHPDNCSANKYYCVASATCTDDNIGKACGKILGPYATKEEAEVAGKNWTDEIKANGYNCTSYYVRFWDGENWTDFEEHFN